MAAQLPAGEAELALLALGCVAFALGVRNLADALREALPHHLSAVVVLALVTAGLAACALANPEVWPLFVLGYPSLASIVVEGWLALRAHLAMPA